MSVTPEPQQTIALVVRHNTAGIDEPVQAIVDFLQGAGYRVVFERETAAHVSVAGVAAMTVDEIGAHCGTAIVVGGDGTMLGIARQLARVDEYVRRFQLENIALSAGLTMAATFSYGFLETAGYDKLSMFSVWMFMGGCWFVVTLARGWMAR